MKKNARQKRWEKKWIICEIWICCAWVIMLKLNMIFTRFRRIASVLLAVFLGFVLNNSLQAELAVYNLTTVGAITGEGKTVSVVYRGFLAVDLVAKDVASVVYTKLNNQFVYSTVSGGWQLQNVIGARNSYQTVASYTQTLDGIQGFSLLRGANALIAVSASQAPVIIPSVLRGPNNIVDQRNGKTYLTVSDSVATYNKAKSFQLNLAGTTLSDFVTIEENRYTSRGYADVSLR